MKRITTTLLFLIMFSAITVAQSTDCKKGYDRSNMDLSVKPGDDFRQYAAGTYIKNHPLQNDEVNNNAFSVINKRTTQQINDIIKECASKPQPKGSIEQKIATLFNQYIDMEGRNKVGIRPLIPWLKKIADIRDSKEYLHACMDMQMRGFCTLMFQAEVGTDLYSDKKLVTISPMDFELNRAYYFRNDQYSLGVRKAYMEFVKKVFTLVGYDEVTADRKMQAVYALQNRLIEQVYTSDKTHNVESTYHKMSRQQLMHDYAGIDWRMVFSISGFPEFNELNVTQPEYIHEVEKVLVDTPLDDLKSFAELQLISHHLDGLTSDFRDAYWGVVKAQNGLVQDMPIEKLGIEIVKNFLGWPVAKIYCEKYFPESAKVHATELVHQIQKAFSQRIDEATWLSAETKAQAKDKLDHVSINVGYPEWDDYSDIPVYDSLSLSENITNIIAYYKLIKHKNLNKPFDKKAWIELPTVANAWYKAKTNEIFIHAAALQPPLFNPEADDALNYGAIGEVIGHELSHGLDDQGCKYDKEGNVHNWWTADDKANYDKRAQILSDHFSTYCISTGGKVNGYITLSENIADNGGLNISLRAMHNAGVNNVVDGLTAEQRFFLAYAHMYAGTTRKEFMDSQNGSDPHSPDEARINATLPMIDEWYKAFGVKEGDKLFVPKEKRVHIW